MYTPLYHIYSQNWRHIQYISLTASVLVRPVIAVLGPVAEESPLDTVAVPTGQVVLLADGLVREEQRLGLLLLGHLVAVGDGPLPVAGLLLQVEGQAGRAADGLQALE
jgi:hypothetical protein